MALSPVAALLCLCLADAAAPAPAALLPPKAIGPTTVAAPSGAPPLQAPLTIGVQLTIDASGTVSRVKLLTPVGTEHAAYARAVLWQATHFHFAPASQNGTAIAAAMVFRQTFVPRPQHAKPIAKLCLALQERGGRAMVAGASVSATWNGGLVHGHSDATGSVCLEAEPGTVLVRVEAPGFQSFVMQERLVEGVASRVRYRLRRGAEYAYETTIIGKNDRVEVGRTSLEGSEMRQVAGTFGDPFRVVTTLPGVSTLFSLLGYPLVRGTTPSSTGFFLDAVPVPQLFHMLLLSSVVHPEFIERVDFYPGTYPTQYGGYTGGIVDGVSPAPQRGWRIDADLNLLQTGAFLRAPLSPNTTLTVAGRYGYPGLILQALGADTKISFWDYQGRLDQQLGTGHLKIFGFGSYDKLTDTRQDSDIYGMQFHRVDATYSLRTGKLSQRYTFVLGVDDFLTQDGTSTTRGLTYLPRARLSYRFGDTASLHVGADASLEQGRSLPASNDQPDVRALRHFDTFVEMPLRLHDDFLLAPGGRLDVYDNGGPPRYAHVEPRLTARYRLMRLADGDLWVKAGAGRTHQPPRPVVPLPTFVYASLADGLSLAWQSSVGIEAPLGHAMSLDVQGYFNYLDRLVMDLAVNPDPAGPQSLGGVQSLGGTNFPVTLGGLLAPIQGRSYGVEIYARHHNTGNFFGWLSYTLSRTERFRDDRWVLFDFDHTHMLQLVVAWRLPRAWQLGGRAQLTTGRPLSTATQLNARRAPSNYRIDLRVDRRVVYNEWSLDFYFDIINVTMAPEYISQADSAVVVPLPTFGLRALF